MMESRICKIVNESCIYCNYPRCKVLLDGSYECCLVSSHRFGNNKTATASNSAAVKIHWSNTVQDTSSIIVKCSNCGEDLFRWNAERPPYWGQLISAGLFIPLNGIPAPKNGNHPVCPYCNKYWLGKGFRLLTNHGMLPKGI